MLSFKANPRKKDALDRALAKGRKSLSHKPISPVLKLSRGVVAERDTSKYWGKLNPYHGKTFAELERLHDDITGRMELLPAYSDWAISRMRDLQKALEYVISAPNWPK